MNVAMSVDLVREQRARVADQLSARVDEAEAAGRRMGPDDERQLARSLIADALVAERRRRLRDGTPLLDEGAEEELAQGVFDALFGLGRLQPLLEDPEVTDIHVNGCDSVHLRLRDGTRRQVEPVADDDEELVELVRVAAARFGRTERRFDAAAPELNLQLPDGSRLFAIMEVSGRPSVSIRVHQHQKVTLADLRGLEMLDDALEAFLTAVMFSRQNLIIGGPWNVGKTTLLRALVHLLPAEERIVTVEDALELGFDRFPELHRDVVALEERRPNIEGEGAVTLADEVRAALRMDPDRLIVGEVRGHEIIPMLNAMSHGTDGSLCTIHADSSRGIFEKLVLYALQAPEHVDREATNLLVANSIDFAIFIDRDRDRHRHIASIREVTGTEDRLVVTNEVFAPGPDGRARPTGTGRISDRRLDELVDAGFDPAWLDGDQP